MKKIRLLGIALALLGLIIIILGVVSIYKDKKFMENTSMIFSQVKCVDKICLSDFTIDNKRDAGSTYKFKLTNTTDETKESGSLIIVFDNGIKITQSYKELQPNESIIIKKTTKTNLGTVKFYELKKKN